MYNNRDLSVWNDIMLNENVEQFCRDIAVRLIIVVRQNGNNVRTLFAILMMEYRSSSSYLCGLEIRISIKDISVLCRAVLLISLWLIVIFGTFIAKWWLKLMECMGSSIDDAHFFRWMHWRTSSLSMIMNLYCTTNL